MSNLSREAVNRRLEAAAKGEPVRPMTVSAQAVILNKTASRVTFAWMRSTPPEEADMQEQQQLLRYPSGGYGGPYNARALAYGTGNVYVWQCDASCD